MCQFSISTVFIQDLDVKMGRLVGIVKDSIYNELTQIYNLDITQCLLWFDIVRLLDQIISDSGKDNLIIEKANFNLTIKNILETQYNKFPFLISFLGNKLEEEEVFYIIKEATEKINEIYENVKADLTEIFVREKDISKIVEKTLNKKKL